MSNNWVPEKKSEGEFDLFATEHDDQLQELIHKGAYKWTNKFTYVFLIIALAVGSAAGGIWYQANQNSSSTSTSTGGTLSLGGTNLSALRAAFGGGGGGNGGTRSGSGGGSNLASFLAGGFGGRSRGTQGVITSIHGNVITIQTSGGQTLTINTTGTTQVLNSKAIKLADLKTGENISVSGPTQTNGTITGTSITTGVIPAGGTGGFGGGTGGFGGGTGRGSGTTAGASGFGGGNFTPPAGGNFTPPTGGNLPAGNLPSGGRLPTTGKGGSTGKSTTGTSGTAGQSGQSGSGQRRGGGLFSNPAMTACLKDNGVTLTAGARPDRTDPKVAAALQTCFSQLGIQFGGAPGGNGGGGFGNGGGQAPAPAPTNS